MLRKRHEADAATSAENALPAVESSRQAEGEVREIRPVEDFRACPICLVIGSAADIYCTGCGTPLAVSGENLSEEPTIVSLTSTPVDEADSPRIRVSDLERDGLPAPLPPIAYESGAPPVFGPTRLDRRHWVAIAGIFVLVLCGVGGTTAFGLFWHSERIKNHQLTAGLSAARIKLANTTSKLEKTLETLHSTAAVAQERRTVLLRAQTVLAKVDPLLSSVDELQQSTGSIQNERDNFTIAADTLINDTITLANYLIQTDPSYIDWGYERQLIDTANADLATVRADHASLGSADSTYGAASSRFGTRATAFTTAVRNLQKQFQQAASK